jgi:Queuine tRNA-ribosyltransferase
MHAHCCRLGVALVPEPGGVLRLRGREALNELGPIEVGCPCMACSGWPDPSVTAATAAAAATDGDDSASSDGAASASSAEAAATGATAGDAAASTTASLDAALVQPAVNSTDSATTATSDVHSSESSDCVSSSENNSSSSAATSSTTAATSVTTAATATAGQRRVRLPPPLQQQHYSRCRLALLLRRDALGCQLVTAHNVCHVLRLMRSMRTALLQHRFPAFVRAYMAVHFAGDAPPQWVQHACCHAGIPL